MELYCSLMLNFGQVCTGYEGGFDGATQVVPEPLLGYLAGLAGILTRDVSHYEDSVW